MPGTVPRFYQHCHVRFQYNAYHYPPLQTRTLRFAAYVTCQVAQVAELGFRPGSARLRSVDFLTSLASAFLPEWQEFLL